MGKGWGLLGEMGRVESERAELGLCVCACAHAHLCMCVCICVCVYVGKRWRLESGWGKAC